ncbi:hypothetical protein IWQ62_000956 [Dispira parvispora]|uniref:NDT80 domain-containing protein n=1 Tax=Dispira parvispora TaxID=1520584 RepID=A0A9W8AZ00_9FUNG|nr:hypothetical protein IWQ62_000956 [Dispira parvispora]
MEPPRPATAIGTYGHTNRLEGGPIRTSNPVSERRYGNDRNPYPVPFMPSPYPSPFPALRKRRMDAVGFTVEAGPFFGPTQQMLNLYSLDHSLKYTPRISAKVDRGFFQADNDWTCYRRNYFQVSAAFNLAEINHPMSESDVHCMVEVDGRFYNVTQFSVGLSAKISSNDKKIELVQHTPKRDKGPQTSPEVRTIRPGGNVTMNAVGSSASVITYERIQFKTATANNGKRRAAQQYYVLVIDLYVHCEDGQRFKIATAHSANLVVRGRSPGHYADSQAHMANHDRLAPHPYLSHPSSFDERYLGMGANQYPSYPQYTPFPAYQSSPMMLPAPNGSSTPAPSAMSGFQNPAYVLQDQSSEVANNAGTNTSAIFSDFSNPNNSGLESIPNTGSNATPLAHPIPRAASAQPLGLNIQSMGMGNAQSHGWDRHPINSTTPGPDHTGSHQGNYQSGDMGSYPTADSFTDSQNMAAGAMGHFPQFADSRGASNGGYSGGYSQYVGDFMYGATPSVNNEQSVHNGQDYSYYN